MMKFYPDSIEPLARQATSPPRSRNDNRESIIPSFSVFLVACLLGAGCWWRNPASTEDQAREILGILEPTIRGGGEATVVTSPPHRSFQTAAPESAVRALASMLKLPVAPMTTPLPNCRWAPADDKPAGMAITVTEFDITGNSARVSVLRTCRERMRGAEHPFENEPTWILRRSGHDWIVLRTDERVTALPRAATMLPLRLT